MSRVILARADDELPLGLVGDLRRERQHLPVQVLPLARVADERAQLVVVEVLGDVVIGAVLHRLHGRLDLADGRDHDDFDERVVLPDDAQDLEAADPRQAHVEQNQIDVFAIQDREGGFATGHAEHVVVTLQDRRQRVAHALVVVDDEDGFRLMNHRVREVRGSPAVIVAGG